VPESKELVTFALLAANLILGLIRWATARESGELITKKDIEALHAKDKDLERKHNESESVIYRRINRIDSRFLEYVPRQEHEKDVSHLRELMRGSGV
jgi:hypothetical protein